MGRLIVSKKGKSNSGMMACGLALIALGFWQLSTGMGEKADTDMQRLIAIGAPMLFLVAGAMMFAGATKAGKTFIHIYDDHIEGNGSLKKFGDRIQSFYFNNRSQYTVTLEGTSLCINSSNGTFYVNLTQPDANEVYRMLTGNFGGGAGTSGTHSAPKGNGGETASSGAPKGAAADKVICQCPACSTKCRVPAGKGKIMVKCPKCGHNFIVTT